MGGIAIKSFAGFACVSIDAGSFRERGGAEVPLRWSAEDQDHSTLGLRAATTMH
jgi:uncharacterized protein with beta-barrel porin domain